MHLVADTVTAAAEGRLPADLNGLNEQMQALGWSPAGSVAPPYCTQWASEGIRADLASEDGSWYVDFIFRELGPEVFGDDGSDSVTEAAESQLPVYEGLLRELLDTLAGRVPLEAASTSRFDHVDFVVSSEWTIGGRPFVMGVLAVDIDLPVLVMARMGVNPAADNT